MLALGIGFLWSPFHGANAITLPLPPHLPRILWHWCLQSSIFKADSPPPSAQPTTSRFKMWLEERKSSNCQNKPKTPLLAPCVQHHCCVSCTQLCNHWHCCSIISSHSSHPLALLCPTPERNWIYRKAVPFPLVFFPKAQLLDGAFEECLPQEVSFWVLQPKEKPKATTATTTPPTSLPIANRAHKQGPGKQMGCAAKPTFQHTAPLKQKQTEAPEEN